MRHTQRPLDFVSIIEVFRNRFIAWFYGNMNAFPHDRSKPDSPTVRTILERLRAGRVVAMFPEGGIRSLERSVLNGGKMRPGVGRLSQLSGAPVVPAVVLGSTQFGRFTAWLPLRRVRYGVIYGQPITVDPSLDKETASLQMEARLRASFALLYDELKVAMGEGKPA
jgi:1-acyl-sn-glycerol-3-phosphate acyltransferase